MRTLAVLIALGICVPAICTQTQIRRRYDPVRIPVRYADPWFIKAMLEGRQIWTPELSTITGFMGWPAETGDMVNRLFEGGKLLVNPTDSSLWFYPDR
jgi:hypothetical protein